MTRHDMMREDSAHFRQGTATILHTDLCLHSLQCAVRHIMTLCSTETDPFETHVD